MDRTVLISIRPQHVSNILSGKKVFEYRKVIPSKVVNCLVLYCTAPVKKIVAVSEVMDCLTGSPSGLWNQTIYGSGIKRQFFRDYFSGHRSASAFMLGNVYKMEKLVDLNELTGPKTPPQSFCYLDPSDMAIISSRIAKKPAIPSSMVFVGGIHGVGKSTICKRAFGPLGHQCVTASSLIVAHGRKNNKEKRVDNISDNQAALIKQLRSAKQKYCRLVLDGHFTLINSNGKIEPVNPQVFKDMNPSQIVLIKGDTKEISRRLTTRDGYKWESSFLAKFQEKEEQHARYVSEKMQIPLQVFDNTISYSKLAKAVQRNVMNDAI